ncbi:ABC transporter ATP-binding protein [Halosimplex amylolyticum]|uniref:ABC transporter ATP-binding protein n=1 Tax=Halosimplex amylolyticum TaxID=3396616 RepID=UPI003F54EB62
MAADQPASGSVSDPIIQLRNTSVTFDMDRGESRVLDSVDLDIQREEVLGVVGESGSGKSMLASSLLDAVVRPGILQGDVIFNRASGESVVVNDLEEEELRQLRWEEISMVFQGAMSSFNPTMTIRGQFKETLDVHDADIEEGMERANRLLSDLYLDPERVLGSYPHELSGGMKQRTLIALSLILEPEVLVMDEPTASLDLLMQRSIISLLETVKEQYDLTLVFISHDLPLVAELADRLGVMYAFEFVELGPTEEILRDAAHPYTRSLLNSTPNLDAGVEQMRPIEGSSPDPVNVPEGCSYHPRCPLADETCTIEDPEFQQVTEDRAAACFYWEDSADAIPFTLTDHEGPDVSRGDEPGTGSPTPPGRADGVVTPGAGDEETVLTLDDVEVHFEESTGFLDFFAEPETVRAVDGISLQIPENQVVALVGESGCGKTTLGKTAIGLQRPTGGSVKYRGQDIWDAKDGRGDPDIAHSQIRRALQIIHQDPGSALNPKRKIKKTLEEPLKRWQKGLSREDREARILGMLETVGMTPPEDYAERYPHQLSGGEQQRVALVRALLMNPDLILADEAISALDVSLRVEMMNLLLDLQDRFNTSFLFISHDLSNARYLTEKADGLIGIMYLGEIVELGPAKDVLTNPRHPYTKALRWATPNLDIDYDAGERPLRKIDIPDPVDPPSGCRFHTRCPEAREVCTEQSPQAMWNAENHYSTCFREYGADHEYWSSPELTDDEPTARTDTGGVSDGAGSEAD